MGVSLSQPPLTRSMVVLIMLILRDLAGDAAFKVAHNALAVFYFRPHNAEAVEGNDGLLGLLWLLALLLRRVLLGAGRVEAGLVQFGGVGFALVRLGSFILNIDVNRGNGSVSAHRSVFTIEFDGLLGAGNGIERSAKIFPLVSRLIALGLL